MSDLRIQRLHSNEALASVARLVEISRNVVEAGASLGWSAPLEVAIVEDYWRRRSDLLRTNDELLMLGSFEGDVLTGVVQLERGHFKLSAHRGEIAKLMVHTDYRRKGAARGLMVELERQAARWGIETLMLDTRPGEPVEGLYASMGYRKTGLIPRTIRGPFGDYQDTVFYYKLLVGLSH